MIKLLPETTQQAELISGAMIMAFWLQYTCVSFIRQILTEHVQCRDTEIGTRKYEEGKVYTLKELNIFWEEEQLWFVTGEGSSLIIYTTNHHLMLVIHV